MLKEKYFINFLPFFICLIYFFYGFWHIPLFPPDEPKYTFAAMKMLESGDYLTPYFNCKLRLEKPIFTYWAIALSYKIFDISDWSARIPTVILMSSLLITLFFIVKREFNIRIALISTLFFTTNFQIYIYSKAVVPEPFLLVFNTLSTFSFYFGIRNNSKKHILLGYLFSGLAFLTKGPLGIVIPFGINIPYFFVKKGFKEGVRPLFNIYGFLLFIAINMPWYGMMIKIHGMQFINEFFILHNLKRFSGSAAMHLYPFYYYIPVVLLSLFFWLAYLPKFIKYLFSPKFNDMEKFLFWWMIFVFLFFSFSKNKLHHYIIIIHPAMSILMALCFDKIEDKKLFSNITLLTLLIFEIGFLFLGKKFYSNFDYNFFNILLFFLPISTLLLLLSNNFFDKKITFSINLLCFFIFTCFIIHYSQTIKTKTMPQYNIVKTALEGKALISYKRDSEDINFYANVCSSKIDSLNELNELINEKIPFLLVVHEKHLKEIKDYEYNVIAKTTTIKNVDWYVLEIISTQLN